MKASVLIIEDEIEIAELIKLYLNNEGIDVFHTDNAEAGLLIIKEKKIDLIVLDINLPGMDGFEFLQTIRKDYDTSVVIVSARQDDEDMILGLGVGADDYITKPFSPKVLAARVRANLRRYMNFEELEKTKTKTKTKTIKFMDYVVDAEAYLIKKEDKKISLSPREFEVLLYLLENTGAPKTPEDIYKTVWGNSFGDLTTVAVHIQRLRKKLEKNYTLPEIIETVHGIGYIIRKETLS
ncbi:MAG: response regulator transcription factor [Spirochaetes bacterium]|nr:response regulator transcription factor [Spirochaetota bacterium]